MNPEPPADKFQKWAQDHPGTILYIAVMVTIELIVSILVLLKGAP